MRVVHLDTCAKIQPWKHVEPICSCGRERKVKREKIIARSRKGGGESHHELGDSIGPGCYRRGILRSQY